MKKLIFTSILLAFIAGGTTLKAQNQEEERLGLPGDNLNLYGVMKLFRESETLEGFEKALNDEKSKINNLDLDGNNYIDYIRVIDNVDNDVHTIVLQVPVNQNENQDVAVFTVMRDKDGKVFIQLIGDEDLYGKDYIIEPIYDEEMAQTPNPGYKGNDNPGARRVTVVHTTAYEIATWPVVRFIYLPGYMGWRSSWYYGYYPPYWRPWTPYYWDYYYGFHYNWYDNYYYSHYRRWNHYRYSRWNDYYYTGHRQRSVYVSSGIQKGTYKTTYSRPESRRDGEAEFAKMYPSQNRRSTDATQVNSNTNSNSNTRRTTTGTSKGAPEQNAGTTRRSTQSETVRTSTESSAPQSSANRRSSTTTTTSKSVSKPAATQRTESRSSAKSSTKAVKAPASTTTRRSSTTTKSEPAKKSTKTETTKSSRR